MTAIPLSQLGWTGFFAEQLAPAETQACVPVRVFALNRHLVDGVGTAGRRQFALPPAWLGLAPEALPTVGDWVLLDGAGEPLRLLRRRTLFKRLAAGREARVQLMAANVDTLFVVTSCNQDFNPSRLERYLALALDAGVEPVVVLTKADQAEEVEGLRRQASALHPGLAVTAIDARSAGAAAALRPWCAPGRTVALVGSSGVGKSTLVNTLGEVEVQETGAVRAGDDKGRHTTTARSLHLLPEGGLLLDSPGLRELQLDECAAGLAELFAEIEEVARGCRFGDCRHRGEAGCAVLAAAEGGALDARRLENYLKLREEQELAAQALTEKRRRGDGQGRPRRRGGRG